MSETHRKLTTIFSADVQDYTRLMGADEEGTLATLKRYRDAMSRLIVSRGGRVVNTWGDGVIAEFPSVVEAVRAAVDIQNELAGLNANRPVDGQMLFRIGINLGDVIVDGDDIYGDGVNIAARLQASAAPGGILISNTVYDQVRNKVAVGFEFLGPLSAKNVVEAVPSYAVRIGDDPERTASTVPRRDADERATGTARGIVEGKRRLLPMFGLIGAALVAINLLSWRGTFWAAWPLLAFACLLALAWVRSQTRVDRGIALAGVVACGLIAINALSWQGTFWAVWPTLGLAIAAGVRWVARR